MPISNTKLQAVYDTLIKGGYEQDYDTFVKGFSGNDNYKNRKKVYDLLKGNGADIGNTYEEFMGRLQVAPKERTEQKEERQAVIATPRATASTAEDVKDEAPTYADYMRSMYAIQAGQAQTDAAIQRANNAVEYGKSHLGLDVKPAVIGENRNVEKVSKFNPESGQVEDTYLTSAGGEYTNRAMADQEQHQIDVARKYKKLQQGLEEERKKVYADIDAEIAELKKQEAALGEAKNSASVAEQGKEQARATIAKQIAELEDKRKNFDKEQDFAEQKFLYENSGLKEQYSEEKEKADERVKELQKKSLAIQAFKPFNNIGYSVVDIAKRWLDPEYGKARATQEKLSEAGNTVDKAIHNETSWYGNLLRGAWDSAASARTWDFGLNDLTDARNIANLQEKADRIAEAEKKGEKPAETLSASEQQMLDALALTSTLESNFSEHVPMAYRVGQSVPESAAFAAAISLNPMSGFGRATEKAAIRSAVGRVVANGATLSKYGKWGVRAMGMAGRVGGDALEALSTTLTTGLPRTLEDMYNQQAGTAVGKFDDRGRVVFDRVDDRERNRLKAFGKATWNQFVENQSEMVGEYFNPIGNFVAKSTKDIRFAREAVDLLLGSDHKGKMNFLNTFRKRAHISGLMGEYAEEVYGNMLNTVPWGDMNWTGGVVRPRRADYANEKEYNKAMEKWRGSVFNAETNIETFLSVAAMMAPMGALEAEGKYVNSYTAKKQLNISIDNLAKYLGQDKTGALVDALRNAESLADMSKIYLEAVHDGTVSDAKQAKALLDVAGRMVAQQSIDTSDTVSSMSEDKFIRDFKNAYAAGHEMKAEDRHKAAREFDAAWRECENTFGQAITESLMGMNPDEFMRLEQTMTHEQKKVAEEFYLQNSRLYGIRRGVEEAVDEEVAKHGNTLREMSDNEGNVWRGSMLEENEYIVPSSIQEEGNTVVVRNSETGEQRMISREQAGEITSAKMDDELSSMRDNLMREANEQRLWSLNHNAKTIAPEVGKTVITGTDEQGNPVRMRVMSVNEDGEVSLLPVRVNGETGQEEAISGTPTTISTYKLLRGQDDYYDEQEQATDGDTETEEDTSAPAEDIIVPTEDTSELDNTQEGRKARSVVNNWMQAEDDADIIHAQIDGVDSSQWDTNTKQMLHDYVNSVKQTNENASTTEQQATEGTEANAREQATEAEKPELPRDSDGNLVYDQVPVQSTIDDLYDGSMDDQEVSEFVALQTQEAEKQLKKAENGKPKMTTNKAKNLSNKRAWEAQVQEAKRKLDYWNSVAEEIQKRNSEAQQQTASDEVDTESRLEEQAAETVNTDGKAQQEEAVPESDTPSAESVTEDGVMAPQEEAVPEADTPTVKSENTNAETKTTSLDEARAERLKAVDNSPAKEEAAAPTDNANNAAYTITPAIYTNKKGKTSDVSLLTFNGELTAEQERAVKEFAKERMGEGRFAPARGWKDRESGGWMFRSEEDARKAAEMVGNDDAVADNQPLTAQEMRDAAEPKKPATRKKATAKKPANRVEVADAKEQKPTEPTKTEQPKQDGEKKLVISDEMKHYEDILRKLLDIGDDEMDGGMKFRDPDALTSQQRRHVYNAGVNYSLGYIDQGFVSFPEFTKAMVSRLGYKIKPWLKSFYEGAKRIPGYDQAMFTPTEEVDAFDVENFDKPHKDVLAKADMIVEEDKAQAAAEKANNELKAIRNEQRKENDEQRAADTTAIAEKAGVDISEAETDGASSTDRRKVSGTAERVDDSLEEVNEQLALLGYYEADHVEKDFNEAYGYMRNAEKKAVNDAAKLAEQLVDDLGLDLYEATHSDKTDKKGNRKAKPLAVANIAPAGGDVTIHLPLAEGRELYVNIQLEPAFDKGDTDRRGDNLEVTGIMCRVENPNASGNDRYGQNMWFAEDVTYDDLLKNVQRVTYKYIPERSNAKDGEYKVGDKVQYSPDGNTWHDAVVAQPNELDGIRIDTGHAPVMWVNAHPDQLRHKPQAESQNEDIANNPQSWVGRTFVYDSGDTVLRCTDILGKYASFEDVKMHYNTTNEISKFKEMLKSGMFKVQDEKPTEPKNEDIFQKAERIAKEAKAEREKKAAEETDIMGTDLPEPAKEKAVKALHGSDSMTDNAALAEAKRRVAKKKTSKKKVKPEQQVGNLFAGLFDKPKEENGTENNDSSSPSKAVAGTERTDTVGVDETGTDGGERTTAVAGTDGKRTTDASSESGRETADGAAHGTDEVGGIQPPVGNRGRDEGATVGAVPGKPTDERGRTDRPRTVQTGETDGGGKVLSSGEPADTTGEGSRPAAVKKQRTPVRKFTNNFRYGADGNEADNYTPAQRLEGNVSAIEVLAKLFKEGRKATDEEKQILSRFRGWGQIDQLSKFYSVDQMRRDTYGNSPYRRLADAIDTLDPDGKKGVFMGIKRAALSSYYTPTKIASAMNSFLSLAGFKGGTFLDPSMGNGIFEGTLPKDIQERTMITGVELDWLSGQISRALYPDADVRICGFEKSELTSNSQDVVTSNVPFGDIEVTDPTWKNDNSPVKRSAQKRIHNYYAVKMLELTRPGGLVAMMTSPAVMDTQSNQHIRRYIAEQGEFLGAVRLPDNTFQGTGAMADIIYIRKWKDEEDAQKTRENPDYATREQAFLSSAETTAPNKRNGEKQKVSHNAYYASNRKNMIGDVVAGNQYNDKSFGLHSELTTDQIAKEVEKAVKRIVGDRKGMLFDTTRTSREVKKAVREEYKGDGNWVSTGNLVIQDGKVGVLTATKNEYGEVTRVFEEQPQLSKQKNRIIAMGEVRTAMKELIAGQIDGLSDTKLDMLRAKLKRAYDEFVSKYGKLQDTDNAVVLNDIDGYTLQALEVWKGGKFQGLSDIFTKNTIKPALKLEDAKTPQEAITTSLAEYGEIRGEYIEKALGANWFEQCGDLVFKEPNATDRYVTRDEYLSGDVVAKLEEAKTAAATDPTFERNVKELEQVQPATIPFDDITIHLGARWIPQEVLNDFVKDTLGLHASSPRNYEWVDGERREIIKSGVVYVPETDSFEINIEAKELGGQADDWKTADKSIKEIFQAALEDKDYRIVRKDKDGNTWIDQEATELANSKVADLRERFEQWLPSDDARVQTMERAYNDRFNRIVLRKWDGSHLNVPGLMGKELRPHQKDAVWMLINNRGGIVDHIVGAGKTLVMQSAIMEMRRMGIAKKPMIVALKSTVPQIAREFKEAYPTARVLAPSEKDFSTENRKKFFAKISLNDYDCIIVSHEQYGKIPHSEEAESDVVNEQLAQLDAMIEYLYGTGDKSQLTKRQIKSLEKRRQNLHAKLEKRLDRITDREFCFENMGIDYLFVDECHKFKSLPYVTSYQNVAGLGEASGSDKAVALLTGIRHLQKMHQGDKGTVFLSGTTITNSLVEIYNLLNYLRPHKLEQLGMPTFDAWASTFAVHTSELEAGVSNEFKMKDRFRYFDNVPELSQLYAEITDVRNDYNLQLPKPKVYGKTVIVPQSDAVAEINREVVNMLQTKDGSYFGIHPIDPKKFPWGLVASGISAKAAVSPRLVFPDMDDSVGKISYCCDNIKKSYDEMKEQKGVQLVFCELGVPSKDKNEYDAYHDIIDRLTKDYGIPREEIAYIQQVKKDTDKEALFQKVRDGKVRILIGGTQNMGTGVNVQTRITDLHMLTVPWQPADLEQCIGRGSRQGNVVAHDFLDNKVRVHYYATEGSLDLYKYQLLDAKGKMFTQFKMGTISGERSFDEGDADESGNIDPAQMVALLSGNPIIFEKSKQDNLVKKLKSLYNGFLRDQQRKKQNYENVSKKVENLERLISLSDSDVRDLQREGFKPDDKGTYPSKVKVCVDGLYYGQDFDKPKEAGQYILEQLKNNKKVVLAGFGLRADVVFVTGDDLLSSHYKVQIGGNNAWSIRYSKRMPQDPTQAGLVFRNLLEQIIHNNEVYHREYDTNKKMLETMPKGDAPFAKQKELDEAIAKQKELDAEYNKLGQTEEDKTKFRLLEDDDPKAIELESLPDSELVPVYRNVQAFEDDALGSPMAFTDAETGERRTLQGQKWNYSNPPQIELTEEQQKKLNELNANGYIMVDGKKSTELQINDGLKFVKPKTKEAQLQYLLKKNPKDSGTWAAYDPYDHAIETPLNTQFAEAYKRPNLVVVRSLIPKSEITEPFHADYALLPTGAHQWNNGRTLYLSRWSKIDKVLTREEEAKLIDEYWKKNPGKREALKTHRDYNRFVPEVRKELEKMGYRFEHDGKVLTPEESLALDEQRTQDVIQGMEGHLPYITGEDIERINAKMSGKWVGEPKEAMENEMAARVEDLSKKLNTPVRIIRTDEEVAALPTPRQRRQKGSFNTLTGEVTVVVPNNANLADVENTFMHEVVGHDGLRVLFPTEEKLNNALDELYRVSNDSIKGTIDRMAQRMYDAEVDRLREQKRKEHEAKGEDSNASYYADMAEAHAEASKKREQFKRDATEEYGADLAGRIGEKGFEKMSADELTFWGKLKAMLQKALDRLLQGLGIPSKRKWGDKEWSFVLHEAHKRKKNGGNPTVFDAADTEVMKRRTGFDETNDREADGRMSDNERFNGELARYQNGDMDQDEMLHLGKPQGVMRLFLPELPIVMRQRILKKGSVKKHNIEVSALANMPTHLSNPIFVFQRSDNALGVLTEMQDRDGKNVCVAIEMNRQIQNGGDMLEVNDIRSVHGRNVTDIVYPIIQNGTLKWTDKEKGLAYLSFASQYVQQEIDKQDLNTAAKIVENFENPSTDEEKSSEMAEKESLRHDLGEARDIFAQAQQARDKEERALRDAITERIRQAGIEVITDEKEGQRVLDMANGSGEKVRMRFGDPKETFADRQKEAVENRGVVMPGLNNESVMVGENIPRHNYKGNIKQATDEAIEAAKAKYMPNGKAKTLHYDNYGSRFAYTISSNALEICLSSKHQGKSVNKGVHLALVEHLEDVINNSIEVEEHPDYIKDGSGRGNSEHINPNALMHRFYGVAVVDGTPYMVCTLIREDVRDGQKNGIHSYEVQKIEMLDKELPSISNGVGKPTNKLLAYPVAKLLKGVEKAHDSDKNLLEESEKRSKTVREHRVFHGSGAEFDHFDHSHMGEGEGAQAYGWGTYVTEAEGIGRTYAEQNPRYEDPSDMELEEAQESIANDINTHYGIEDAVEELMYDGDGGFQDFTLKRDKETLERWRNYFTEHPEEWESYEDASDFDLEDEDSREEFARQIEISIFDTAIDIARKYDDVFNGERRYLYTVEIPEDTGENYIAWDEPLSDEQIGKIRKYLADNYRKNKVEDFDASIAEVKETPNAAEVNAWSRRGENIYKTLKSLLGTDKEASNALSEMGFTGIKYPADFRNGGREDGKKNYVIFNEDDAKITDQVRFFRGQQGEAYGFTVGGRIYIDPRIANAETPIHEYTHLWATALQQSDSKAWKNIVSLMKGTSVWNEVRKAYHELNTDEKIADEVLATYSGRRGAERLREEARKMTEGKDVFEMAEAMNVLDRVRQALRDFWSKVARMLHLPFTSAEEVADQVMRDLLDGKNMNAGLQADDTVREKFKFPNRGYGMREDGTTASIRALEAEEEGKYSKGKFQTVYKVARADFNVLNLLGVIDGSEWHHTGQKFTRTTFYAWANDAYRERYTENKKEIGKLVKQYEAADWDYWKEEYPFHSVYYFAGHKFLVENPMGLPDWKMYDSDYVDEKLEEYIANNREALEEEYEADTIEKNAKLKEAREHNAQSRGKEYILLKIADVMGMDKEKTEKNVGYLSSRYRVEDRASVRRGEVRDIFQEAQQARDEEETRFSLRNNNQGSGWSREAMQQAWDRAMSRASFMAKEGYWDYLASVEEFQNLIAKATGKKISDLENAYQAMLALSSRNANEMKLFDSALALPLQKAVLAVAGAVKDFKTGNGRALAQYLIAKHGIERNRDMAVRAALKEQAGNDVQLYTQLLDNWYSEAERIKNNAQASKWTWRQTQEALTQAAETYGADMDTDYSGLTGMLKTKDTGLATSTAYDMVEAYEGSHEGLIDLWQAIHDMSEYSLDKQHKTGLVGKDYVDDQRRRYEYYVPLRGFADQTAEDMYDYLDGQRANGGLGSPVKTAKGRASESADPLGNLLNVAYRSIASGNKNMAIQHFYNLVNGRDTSGLAVTSKMWVENVGTDAAPDWALAEPQLTDPATGGREMTGEEVQAELERFNVDMEAKRAAGRAKQLAGGKSDPQYRIVNPGHKRSHLIRVNVGGKARIITIAGNPRVAMALNGLLDPDNSAWPILQRTNNFMASAFTNYNVSFGLANLARDTMQSNMRAFIMENPLYWSKFTAKQGFILGNVANCARIIKMMLDYKVRKAASGHHEEMFKEFMEGGGATGYTMIRSQEEASKFVADLVRDLKNAKRKKINPLRLFDLFSFLNESTELVNRFIAYETSREMGRTIERSIDDAKEATLNFNRKGAGAKSITSKEGLRYRLANALNYYSQYGRSFIVFFNAFAQSERQLYKMMTEHPAKFTAAFFAAPVTAAAVALPTINNLLLPALYSAIAGDGDDEDKYEDYYDELSDWERQHNICLRLPKGWGWIKIPLSQELATPFALGDITGAASQGKRDLSAADASVMLDLVAPNNINGSDVGTSLVSLMPSATQFAGHIAINRDFKGSKLYNDSPFAKYQPNWRTATRNTSKSLVALSRAENALAGGSDERNADALYDWKPGYVQEMLTGLAGGWASTALAVSDAILPAHLAGGGTEKSFTENTQALFERGGIPVVSRFVIPGSGTRNTARAKSNYISTVKPMMGSVESELQLIKGLTKDAAKDVARTDQLLKDAMKSGDIVAIAEAQKAKQEATDRLAEKAREQKEKLTEITHSERWKKYRQLLGLTKYIDTMMRVYGSEELPENVIDSIQVANDKARELE